MSLIRKGQGRNSIVFNLFDQPLAHFENGQGEEDDAEKQKISDFPQQGEMDLAIAKSPRKAGEMSERKEKRRLPGPMRKILKGEEGSAEEKHGCDKQKYG